MSLSRRAKTSRASAIETGDHFKVTVTTGTKILTNSFTIGQETELEAPTGEKVNVGGACHNPTMSFIHVAWIYPSPYIYSQYLTKRSADVGSLWLVSSGPSDVVGGLTFFGRISSALRALGSQLHYYSSLRLKSNSHT